jgi:hypothetical protein
MNLSLSLRTAELMRSVWFSLIGPSVSDVERWLHRHGIAPIETQHGRHVYPPGENAVLYITCENYDWVQKYDLQEEYDELLHSIGGGTPTVQVSVDVSGRVAGDDEVRLLVRILLGEFRGFAFDDFLSYSHAWTLAEIEGGVLTDGLKFFDYRGHFDRSKSQSN